MKKFIIASVLALGMSMSLASVAIAQEDTTEIMAPIPPGMIQQAPDGSAQPADPAQLTGKPLPVVPLPPDPARKPLDDWLAKIKGSDAAQLSVVNGEFLKTEFPGYRFYALHFRIFPANHPPIPEPLKAANVFALAPDGTVTHIPDQDELKDFFRHNVAPALRNDQARDILKAWLPLVLEFKQDGYYDFSKPGLVNLTSRSSTSDMTASVKVTATRGGHGDFTATLTFGEDGRVLSPKVVDNIKAGPRP